MDLSSISLSSLPDMVVGTVVALIALALGIRKLHAMYAADGVSIAKVNSELDIITLLRDQIKELANANKELRYEIGSLRQLNKSLASENDEIKSELRALQSQIRLLSTTCLDCPSKQQRPIVPPASSLADPTV